MDPVQRKVDDLEQRIKKLEEVVFQDKKDILLDDVIKLVSQYEEVSASLLQRRFSIGYARAARLLDLLTEKGIIASGDGSTPRKVLHR